MYELAHLNDPFQSKIVCVCVYNWFHDIQQILTIEFSSTHALNNIVETD